MTERPNKMVDGKIVPLTDAEWQEYRDRQEVEPAPLVTVLFPADLWRRTTEDEAEQIEQAMAAQPARLRNLFRSASTYQSDDPLWSVLLGAATQLFGADRAAELLAPSA